MTTSGEPSAYDSPQPIGGENASARWLRLQELFDELVLLAPDKRRLWLEGAEDDASIRDAAMALVDADSAPGDAIARHVGDALLSSVNSSTLAGAQLGTYRLLHEIGSGGMGTVFLAERVDAEFDRRVAIKLIRGIATRDASQRLRRERQILANLSHPNIGRLLDGGTSDAGQPYLVMEFIEGETITEYCRNNTLPRTQRLRLMQQVCRAVHYAHQRLVIHRDLKPANVLVREDGSPVLLDFGIAKLIDANASGPQQTQTGIPWFTPAYASPEQRRGGSVSTATDIYGLGALLLELLTDQIPNPDRDGRLPLPSAVARKGDAARVSRELDLIVATATHADADRRYPSAQALSNDIERFLRSRPIHAAPDTFGYRAAKLIRRNRLATAAVMAAVVMSIGLGVRLASERDRALQAETLATRESMNTQQVVDYLVSLFRAAEPGQAANQPINPRELIDRGRKEIDARLEDQPLQRARLLSAFGKIYIELGLPDQAAESLSIAADLEANHGSVARQAGNLADLGYAYNLAERTADAERALQRAVSVLDQDPVGSDRIMSDLLSTLSLSQARNGNLQAGLVSAHRAIEFATRGDGGDSVRVAQDLAALAEVQMRAAQLDAAEQSAKRGIALLSAKLPEDSPEIATAKGFLSQVYEKQGRFKEGEEILRDLLEQRLKTLDPASSWAITARNNLAQAIQLQGRVIEAIALMRENVQRMRDQGDTDSPSYLIATNNVASLLEQTGDFDAALPLFREVLERAEQQQTSPSPQRMALFRQNLGRILMLVGKLDEAWPLLDRAVEGPDDAPEVVVEKGRRFIHLAEWMWRSRRLGDALDYVSQAEQTFGAVLPPRHPRLGGAARLRGLVLQDQGAYQAAEAELRRARDLLAEGSGPNANATLDAELQLAEILVKRGKVDEARDLIAHVAPFAPERFVAASPTRRRLGDLQQIVGSG